MTSTAASPAHGRTLARQRPAGCRRWPALAAAILVAAGAGCGSATPPAAPLPAPPPPPGLATSLVTGDTTWAVVVLGGSAASYNNFWEVFVRPAGGQSWRLATPPGVAENGGIVLAGLSGQSAIAASRPSQDLIFSPLASTADGGSKWATGLILDARLAAAPGALAAAPNGRGYLALLTGGQVDQAGRGAASWRRLTSLRSLAASPAGRRCAPRAVTGVSFSPSGGMMLAADCTRPGETGIFGYSAGTWRAAGPALTGPLAGRRVQVLRLARTGAGEAALLAAWSRGSTVLLAGWTSDGTHWRLSRPVSLGTQRVASAGFGGQGQAWVLLSGVQAYVITGPGGGWRLLPRPPAHTAALAPGPAGAIDALAAHRSTLTDWRLAGAGWREAQSLHVRIPYGSSG